MIYVVVHSHMLGLQEEKRSGGEIETQGCEPLREAQSPQSAGRWRASGQVGCGKGDTHLGTNTIFFKNTAPEEQAPRARALVGRAIRLPGSRVVSNSTIWGCPIFFFGTARGYLLLGLGDVADDLPGHGGVREGDAF